MSAFKIGSYVGLFASGTAVGVFTEKSMKNRDVPASVLGKFEENVGLESWSNFNLCTDVIDTDKEPNLKRGEEIMRYGRPKLMSENQVLYNQNHVLQFDARTRTPIWVAEHITKSHAFPLEVDKTAKKADRKKAKFRPDPRLSELIRSENEDFWNSGWSRGHMAPSGNNGHCQNAMNDTFQLSNIVPQDFDNNGDFWNRFEIYCRTLTKTYKDVRIISGPLWMPDEDLAQLDVINPFNGKPFKKHKTMTYPVSFLLRSKIFLKQINSGDWEKQRGRPDASVQSRPSRRSELGQAAHGLICDTEQAHSKRDVTERLQVRVTNNRRLEVVTTTLKIFSRVPLKELEAASGIIFHEKLDRDRVDSLCDSTGCQMQNYREFQAFYVTRGMNSSRTERELERYWKKARVSPVRIYSLFFYTQP